MVSSNHELHRHVYSPALRGLCRGSPYNFGKAFEQLVGIFPCHPDFVSCGHGDLSADAALFNTFVDLYVDSGKFFLKPSVDLSLTFVMFTETYLHELNRQRGTGRNDKYPLGHLCIDHKYAVAVIADKL